MSHDAAFFFFDNSHVADYIYILYIYTEAVGCFFNDYEDTYANLLL